MSGRRHVSTVRLRRLAAELRQLRDSAQMTREDVTTRTSINTVTLYRIETAKARPQARTLQTLLDLYGVPEPRRTELIALSREAAQRGWLHSFPSELPEHYTTYIGFESEAESVRNYESLYMPGLLQTQEYAEALVRGVLPTISGDDVDSRVRARLERQKLLTSSTPLQLSAIVSEASLHCRVGSAKIMRKQLEHLIEVSAMSNVTFQVIPFEVGAYPGIQGSFAVLHFTEPDPDIVYLESMAGDLFLEADVEINRYNLVFDYLRDLALSPEASRKLTADFVQKA
ncbi:helix-turn-helix domain-containing protein [Streptosporangium sp. V21-05]|uniref:helix-turn-helix domain-containing protein n=1 Tax=Streptosporangium sp. V21-05 TaxID=3446115 RepID=UPI003F52E618